MNKIWESGLQVKKFSSLQTKYALKGGAPTF